MSATPEIVTDYTNQTLNNVVKPKRKRKVDPPPTCIHCLKPIPRGNRYARAPLVEGQRMTGPIHWDCKKVYKAPKALEENLNGDKIKEAKVNKQAIKISRLGDKLSITKFLLVLNDEELATVFFCSQTRLGAHCLLSPSNLRSLLVNMAKVAKDKDWISITIKLHNFIEKDFRIAESEEYVEFYRDFRSALMGDRMALVSRTIQKFNNIYGFSSGFSFAKVDKFFEDWILNSFREELKIPHKWVGLSSNSKEE